LAEEYEGEIAFAGVSNNDTVPDGKAYVREFDVPYAMGHSPETWEAFGDPFRPTTLVFDSDGVLAHELIGEVTYESLKEALEDVTAG
jgi:hypothetical protein